MITVGLRQLACGLALLLGTTAFAAAQAQHKPAEQKVPMLTGTYGRDTHNYAKPYSRMPRGYVVNDGYNNEYLKPWAVELLHRDGLVDRNGLPIATAHSLCYPEGVPYVFGGAVIQILQSPDEITFLFADAGQFRTVYLNRPHSNNVQPSYWGESVGHFEGDTLVIDTVGIAYKPQAGSMGFFGTPHSEGLHLVERWRFLRDGEVSTAPPPENDSFDIESVIQGAKHLRLTFTVEDQIAYKKPWSITLDYVPISQRPREYICAENSREPNLAPLLPTADVPDF